MVNGQVFGITDNKSYPLQSLENLDSQELSQLMNSKNKIRFIDLCSYSSKYFIAVYSDIIQGYKGKSIIGKFTGSEIVHFPELTFNNNTTHFPEVTALDNSRITVVYKDITNTNSSGTAIPGIIINHSISWGSEHVFTNESPRYYTLSTLNNSNFVISYNDDAGNMTGYSRIATYTPPVADSDGDGIADADDDYPNDPNRAFDNYFPAAGFGSLAFDTTTITMIPNGAFSQEQISLNTWNPFIIVDQTRGYEVHLADYPPTDLVDNNYFGTFEDNSDPLNNRYYKTANNLPWGIDIPAEFDWPIEKKDIISAYLYFATWAESEGQQYNDWYEDNSGYRDDSKIYDVP